MWEDRTIEKANRLHTAIYNELEYLKKKRESLLPGEETEYRILTHQIESYERILDDV